MALYVAIILVLVALLVQETRRYNRRNPSPEQRASDRRRTAIYPATWTTAMSIVLAIIAVASAIRGWWLIAIVDSVALVPMVWFSWTRWRLYRSWL